MKRWGVTAACFLALVLMIAPVALFDAEQAQAGPSLQCGNAELELGPSRTDGYLLHSCTGTGTVLYTINTITGSFQISHFYHSPGFSIRRKITSDGVPMTSVTWELK